MSVAIVSIHDVAPATWEECSHLIGVVEEHGVYASLLVVPGPWRSPSVPDHPGFLDWLRATSDRGHEVVAHGWEHRAVLDVDARPSVARRLTERLLTRGCAEFSALGAVEAEHRARRSIETLTALGFDPVGFVAPGWSLSHEARSVLAGVGFGYTATRLSVVDLVEETSIAIPAVCHRPASPLAMLGARMLIAVVELSCRERRSIRLALHPDDVHDDRLDRASRRALESIAASGLDVVTYAALIESCRGGRIGVPG